MTPKLLGENCKFVKFLFFSLIPKRDLDTNKTTASIEVCPESLGWRVEISKMAYWQFIELSHFGPNQSVTFYQTHSYYRTCIGSFLVLQLVKKNYKGISTNTTCSSLTITLCSLSGHSTVFEVLSFCLVMSWTQIVNHWNWMKSPAIKAFYVLVVQYLIAITSSETTDHEIAI